MKASIILCTLIAASALLAAAGETKNAPAAEGAKKTSLEGKTVANADNNLLKNGSFNEPASKPNKAFKDGKAPSGWNGGKFRPDGELEWIPIAPGSTNYAVHGKNCRIYNNIGSRAKKFTVHFRYKGKGDLWFYVYRYDGRKGSPRPSKIANILENVDAADWTSGKFEFDNPAEDDTERQVLAVHLNGDFFIDEIYLAPVSK